MDPNSIAEHVDMDTLNMLKEIMEDGFSALLETYISDSEVRVNELRESLAAGDSETVRRSAHSLKGSSGNLGANQMAALCLHVEDSAKEERLDGLDVEVEKISSEYQAVKAIMQSLL